LHTGHTVGGEVVVAAGVVVVGVVDAVVSVGMLGTLGTATEDEGFGETKLAVVVVAVVVVVVVVAVSDVRIAATHLSFLPVLSSLC